ncbi:MAG: Asp-tRNA(Asn)/Glu-tRNA(Gln) amidotransferase subunit GatB [Candidatus Aenigmarchaeota archaeon]|nr:Asp-tRNA(Asn)/Glu-tRNA(Gln) amidotransferase subunit GatB [Candidatus Aenigmarchaeota archaeon]
MKVMIGLETHVQLNTASKIFCGCRNPAILSTDPEPNTLTCPTCLGLPGSKPRANGEVVCKALKIALAMGCRISCEMFFSRKTYFYPDMAKDFQITQYEIPLGTAGQLEVGGRKIRIRRVHMEEDPAKLVHVGGIGGKYVLVDYNRSGIPLVEIVTEPDMTSPREARIYLQKLELILEYLGLYDPSTKAVFKSDANISLTTSPAITSPAGTQGGQRIEIKNITGTKEIEDALNYEIIRQKNMIEKGQKIRMQTRMWSPELKATQELREKETEEDYGYIFEPDLPVIEIGKKKIQEARNSLPELPDQKENRFIRQYKINRELAESIVSEPDLAELFEDASKKTDPMIAASWIAGYLKKTLNYNNLRFKQSGLQKNWIIELLGLFMNGKLTDRNAELVIRKMVEEKQDPEFIIKKYGFEKAGMDKEAEKAIKATLEKNRKAAEDYRKGEKKALEFLVGLAMRETKGRIDANEIREALLRLLGAR